MEKFFKIKERGSSFKAEIIGGLTTFMAMAYILMVNADMFTAAGVSYGAVYIATAISAVVGTLIMALLANLPLGLASGMGANAFFVFTVVGSFGFSYANALLFVLADGVIFILLTVTGLRKTIFNAIPQPVKAAIPAGIGLFIAFLGFQKSGLVVNDDSTLVGLHSFNLMSDSVSWSQIMPILVALLVLVAIAAMSKKKIKGAILWGILGGTALYYVFSFTISGFDYSAFTEMNSIGDSFKSFYNEAFLAVFTKGFDFTDYLAVEGHTVFGLVIAFISTALAFCLVDMFDTMGTLYGACRGGGLLVKNEKGEEEVPNMNRAMLADAVATTVGAACGTSTVTTFVESSSGVAAGARTGFASLITAGMFFIAMFLSPLTTIIPSAAYAAALIYVGILMISCVKDIDWSDPEIALPAFSVITFMPFTYSISYGIAFGILTYVLVKLFTGKVKEISISTWVILALFILMFLTTH